MTVYIGIDWSRKKHDIVITDESGKRISSGVLEQSQAGYAKLEQMCEQLQVSRTECRVGLETAHTLLIDYLWQQGYEQVFVIHPNIVNRSRERYRQSGAYNDQSDAYVISDLLRTDGHRFTAWQPGSELLQTLRRETSLAHFLTRQSTRQANRLEAILLRYYPVARQLFSWPSPIVCHFVMTYPTPQASQALSYDEFCQFLKSHRHTQSRTWVTLYDRLHASQPKASAAVVAACQEEAKALAQMLLHFWHPPCSSNSAKTANASLRQPVCRCSQEPLPLLAAAATVNRLPFAEPVTNPFGTLFSSLLVLPCRSRLGPLLISRMLPGVNSLTIMLCAVWPIAGFR